MRVVVTTTGPAKPVVDETGPISEVVDESTVVEASPVSVPVQEYPVGQQPGCPASSRLHI